MPRKRRGPRLADPYAERIGLIRLRTKRGLTQGELAAAVGCRQGHISGIESGKRNPSYGLLGDLADVLKVKVDELEELVYGGDEVGQARRPA